MRTLIIISALLSFLGMACEDDGNESPKIIIATGKVCGWCGGADSLAITSIWSAYEFRSSCAGIEDKKIVEKTLPAEWSDLLASLNWNDFKDVNVNTCALCGDGCDTWINIKNGDETHRIRFTESSPEIEPIQTFVQKLSVLHEEFRQK